MPSGVYPRTSEACLKQAKKKSQELMGNSFAKGSIRTAEMRKQHSLAVKGKTLGSKNGLWKGNDVGYDALHSWIERMRGKAFFCEDCGIKEPPQGKGSTRSYFQWANISHCYLRIVEDWKQLCYKCHKAYDSAHQKVNNTKIWLA